MPNLFCFRRFARTTPAIAPHSPVVLNAEPEAKPTPPIFSIASILHFEAQGRTNRESTSAPLAVGQPAKAKHPDKLLSQPPPRPKVDFHC